MNENISPLQKSRIQFQPTLPKILQHIDRLALSFEGLKEPLHLSASTAVKQLFPQSTSKPLLSFQLSERTEDTASQPLLVGVVLSGGQAPGGHNVIAGLFDALKKIHPNSKLIGFLGGPKGIIDNRSIEITEALLSTYRNQGGFDLIGSGRDKIETNEQFNQAEQVVSTLKLNGLVIIGGDDSNTNAALLAEYFSSRAVKCSVIGVPKTIDGDLKNEYIEVSFGFDTACKIYSEIIGNIARDALSARKYYYFIKLMGRSASHIALECFLQTHPNFAFIGEEIESQEKTIKQLIDELCDLICQRASVGKNYGVILIPEGVIEFIPEFKNLIVELNQLSASGNLSNEQIEKKLSSSSQTCFSELPQEIRSQLLLDRDPHGNIQISKIETERLFIHLVDKELKERKKKGVYSGKFNAQPEFCGYEGRSGMPSHFDSHYCYALGHVAALLIKSQVTGYMSCVRQLQKPVEEWSIAGVPLVSMMHLEERQGKMKAVIRKTLVNLQGPAFQLFMQQRQAWGLEDQYRYPGPIQFFGPKEITDSIPITLSLERQQ